MPALDASNQNDPNANDPHNTSITRFKELATRGFVLGVVKSHSKVLAERRSVAKEKIKAAAAAAAAVAAAMEEEIVQSQAAVDAFSDETSRKTSDDDAGDSNEHAKSMIDGTVFRFLEIAPEDRYNDGNTRGCFNIHDEDIIMF